MGLRFVSTAMNTYFPGTISDGGGYPMEKREKELSIKIETQNETNKLGLMIATVVRILTLRFKNR